MNIALMVLSIVMNLVCYGILRNEMCRKYAQNDADLHAFNAGYSLAAMAALLVICMTQGSLCVPSLYTCALAAVFGLATALCAAFILKAFAVGPFSYTNLIVSCAMVIPAFSGALLYGERISVGQYVGVALTCLSFACGIKREEDGNGASIRWFLFCLIAFLFSGMVGVIQKVHQNSPYKGELGVFLVIAFAVAALYSAAASLVKHRREKLPVTVVGREKLGVLIRYSVLCGVGIALCNQINMFLAGVIPSIIFYPIINGSAMILNTVAGVALWKERLTRRQWAGVGMGFVAILLLCNLF